MVRVKRLPVLVVVFWAAASVASAERAYPRASTDFDAEFARAADLLEEGKRDEAERVLENLLRNADQPAWNARAAMLLGAADARRDDWRGAALALEAASAGPIGLEAYRNLRRAEALELSGRQAEALEPARLAFEAEGRFAYRIRAATLLARLCEQQGKPEEAARVLALAAEAASTPDESAEVAIDADPPRRRAGRRARGAGRGARSSAARADARRPLRDAGLRAARGGRGREDALAGRPRPARTRARRGRRPPAGRGPALEGSQRRLAGRGARSEPARARAGTARVEEDEGGGGDGVARCRRRDAFRLRGPPLPVRPRRGPALRRPERQRQRHRRPERTRGSSR